ncbi:MAG: hypothetical protein A3H96_05685 [Acidobacteria bacterium RIFCSPLOWO2_02_FULL_67_36]|nr:MAG: hypothetical protein A3H96_05685 [Acidobacteria bacterium RIFCSPLOWO2_02_FULL_67_36]OFW19746.1 MAG: hypothetical protein A3G21_13265 [Acidobacteria bacterium RIFCSPLOWO2_12_FULL_66_21]
MTMLDLLSQRLQEGDDAAVRELTARAIAGAVAPAAILEGGLLAGMAVIGRRFRDREIFLPDVLLAARAMQAGMALLEPLLVGNAARSAGTVVIGTVSGDVHDIGKNLVGIMLQGAGFRVVDLGADVAPERFAQTAAEERADVVGLSALLTTTMTGMQDTIEQLREDAATATVRTIVGGAPLTAEFAREIGADAYAPDAQHAVEGVRALVQARRS